MTTANCCVGAYGTATDIDDRKQAEQASADSEARCWASPTTWALLAWIADGSGAIVWYNRRWFEYTGTTVKNRSAAGAGAWCIIRSSGRARDQEVQVVTCAAERPGRDTRSVAAELMAAYRWFLARATPDAQCRSGKVIRWFGYQHRYHRSARGGDRPGSQRGSAGGGDGAGTHGDSTSSNFQASRCIAMRAHDRIVGSQGCAQPRPSAQVGRCGASRSKARRHQGAHRRRARPGRQRSL